MEDKLRLAKEFEAVLKKARHNYFKWIETGDISFIETITLISIRDYGYLDKRIVMEDYFLSNQSINNVINRLLKLNILKLDIERTNGHNKIYLLTEKGQEYSEKTMSKIDKIETSVIDKVGVDEFKECIRIYSLINDAIVEVNNDLENVTEN